MYDEKMQCHSPAVYHIHENKQLEHVKSGTDMLFIVG